MKNILKKVTGVFYGKKILQGLFIVLHKISLKGMGFGTSETSDSGEKYALQLIQKETKDCTPTILDVGANKGQYANLINSVFGGKAKIYSFEPGNFTFGELTKNTSAINNIKIYNFGLGSERAMVYLNYDNPGSGLASVYKRRLEHSNIELSKKEEVEIRKIDDFCLENKITKIDLLKIDTEGHELEVLRGAKTMINKNSIWTIQFEFGGCNIDSKTYFQDFYNLLKDKYTVYRILKDGLFEIKKYSELYEIFTTVNYFAKLK